MTEMTPAQLTHELDRLTEEVRQMKNLLALFMVNGLQDAFDGTGNQTYGGGVMRLDRQGAQIKGTSLQGAIYFVDAFKSGTFNTATDTFSRLSGFADTTNSISGIALDAFSGGENQGTLYLETNAAGAPTAYLLCGNAGFSLVRGTGANLGKVNLGYVGSILALSLVTSDPANLADGHVVYRSDTDRYRVRANSITRNLTMDGTNTTLTIATGVVTVTTSFHAIDTEAAAATDDLDTISGGETGQVLHIHAANGARDVVAKDGTGNLKLAGDFTMNNTEDVLTLIFDGTNWLELGRSDNGA